MTAIRSAIMQCVVIFVLSMVLVPCAESRGVNGGVTCAACTIVFGITDQLAEIHNETVLAASLRLCDMVLFPVKSLCKKFVHTLEPILINEEVSKFFTPDVLCYSLNFCHKDDGHSYCHLFPRPMDSFYHSVQHVMKLASPIRGNLDTLMKHLQYNFCRLPVLRHICELVDEDWMEMSPAVDFDGDLFSIVETARGSHWRGKDCRDWDADAYPGRQPRGGDADGDYNCNGIWGTNSDTGKPWEEELCGESDARGVIFLGDSLSAHFHFPEVWMNPQLISPVTAHNYTAALLDELDWPQFGFATGYSNSTQPFLIKGRTDSIYLRLQARNRCNHRDYQNVCRNGASSEDLRFYVNNVARNKTFSKPAVVFYAAFGNDVCNSFADTAPHMTTPERFHQNVLHVLEYLNDTLPSGSHVLLLGLVNGEFIFPTMASRLHPLGKLRHNVYYRDVYRWFTCMEIGPCVGWMSPNITLRNIASERSRQLSHVLKELAASEKFEVFQLHYLEHPLQEVIENWRKQGKPLWQIIEPVDSLHPNQAAQPLIVDVLWRDILREAPYILGKENSNNAQIIKKFGDQGGH